MHFGEDLRVQLVEAIYKQPSDAKHKCIALARQLNSVYCEENALNERLSQQNHESFQRLRELHDQTLAALFEGGGPALADPAAFFSAEEQAAPEFARPAPRAERRGWWGRTLRAVPNIAECVEPEDEAVLEFLTGVDVITQPARPDYTVEFRFEPNPFFHNDCLRAEVLREAEGEEVVELRSTPIQWKDGKELTAGTKTTKSRGKNRPRKTVSVRKRSFFLSFANLREPEEPSEDGEVEDDEAPPSDAKVFYQGCEVFETIRFDLLPCLVPLLLGVKVALLGDAALPAGATPPAKPECKAQ